MVLLVSSKLGLSLSNPEKIVVRAVVSRYCQDRDAGSRLVRAIENPSRETRRILLSSDDARVLKATLQERIKQIHQETGGKGQLTCQALQSVIDRIGSAN